MTGTPSKKTNLDKTTENKQAINTTGTKGWRTRGWGGVAEGEFSLSHE